MLVRRVIDERPVGILHGYRNRWLALRVLGDLRGFGVAATLVRQGPSDVRVDWSHVRGLVVVQSSDVEWTAHELVAMHAMQDNGTPVVLAHLSGKSPRERSGLRQYPLIDRNYKVDPSTGAPGHQILAEMFGAGPPPEDEQRRGYVFVSYAGVDVRFVSTAIVPALVEQGFGFFDYRGTEELVEAELDAELRRWVERCAVLLVVATRNWPGSAEAVAELQHAHALERGVVILRRRSWPRWQSEHEREITVRFDDPGRDGPKVGAAIRRASDPRRRRRTPRSADA